MKQVLGLFVLLIIIAGGIFLIPNYFKSAPKLQLPSYTNSKNPTVTIDSHIIKLTVARTSTEKETGLSKTNSLPEDQGMIFMFDKPAYPGFWMRNMTIPIDIIFLKNDTVVTIYSNVAPPKSKTEGLITYTPLEPSDRVLEIQAGLSEKYNLKKGDRIKYGNLSN